MSASQVTVIVVCLVVGYITVSWLLDLGRPADKSKAPPGGPSPATPPAAEPPPAGPSRAEAPRPDPRRALAWNIVLDLDASANRAAITAAYREKISQYHPDKVARMGPEIRELAERKSAEINAAYEAAIASLAQRGNDR